VLRRALDWLLKNMEVNNTYVRGIRANVWEYALRKASYDERLRAALKTDYEWLLKARANREAWRYTCESRDWDNSCSQYGVLGIWAAARAGMEPGEEFWKDMAKHFTKCQDKAGGWGYTTGNPTPNMTTAGLASMFLVFDMCYGKTCFTREQPRTFADGPAADCLKSIARGMEWLGRAGLANNDAYFLYGIERVGVASGRKYIGDKDWFKEGALAALRDQQQSGLIYLKGPHGDDVVRTAFSSLFLVYGGAPVAFNKLEYGAGYDWNLNPRDLANLTKDLWSAYEQPLNWHSVSIKAPVEEFEAPILFISGSQAAKFGKEETAKLRGYLLRGGTIFAEPSDRSPEFLASMKELLREMFPEKDYPAVALAPLPPAHGIYTVLKQDWKKRPSLSGASDGSRTFFFLSDDYLSGDWQMNRTESDAFKLGLNLLFYVTDLAMLQGKFASGVPDRPAVPDRKQPAKVARIHPAGAAGEPMDWAAGSASWQKFAPYFQHVSGYTLKEEEPVALTSAPPAEIKLLHLTGRKALKLSADERKALKEYVDKGGTILVDAYAGSPEFARAARAEIEDVFGKLQPLDAASILATGRFQGGQDLTHGLKLKLPARKLIVARDGDARRLNLEVVLLKGRPAVLFSEFDLSAGMAGIESYQCVGYKPDSARMIAANLLAYAMAD
jgi:hypothetical protein